MRRIAMICSAALVASLLAIVGVWVFAEVGRAQHGSEFGSLGGSLAQSWPAAVGFVAMPVAFASAVALVLLAVVWVARDLRRTRA